MQKICDIKPGTTLGARDFSSAVSGFRQVFIVERLRFTFTLNGKREFVPRDQVFPLIVVNCLLLQLTNKQFHASFIHKNCSGEFLSAYFLF